jgi:hypothetical protein
MKKNVLIIFLVLFALQVNGQNLPSKEIKIDKKLQQRYFDTIWDIEKRLNGEWLYFGSIDNSSKTDTNRVSWEENDFLTIDNGFVYKQKNGVKTRVEKYSVVSYDFHFYNGSYIYRSIFQNKSDTIETEITTAHLPRPKVVFHDNRYGILWMGGDNELTTFDEIVKLNSDMLIIGNEKYIRFSE